ncbi:MAG: hypothetical protein M3017_13815 [Actinomycetota bacterium]|nr:hypothetical protein [Actinomycetota bacterium]
MPKKKPIRPIRPELVAPLIEILRDKGHRVADWPADERKAYRNAPDLDVAHAAVAQVRFAKAAEAIEEIIRVAQVRAFIDGVAESQSTTGFY